MDSAARIMAKLVAAALAAITAYATTYQPSEPRDTPGQIMTDALKPE